MRKVRRLKKTSLKRNLGKMSQNKMNLKVKAWRV
ncbi:hypothetical protein HRED_07741 [Candidatus Haloredivivus sp. G17]|nr:hypothetical protein HRED_10127 [Candidatus Haloredivivus sp. G17]EHK01627.1 hypothetical protein HRED_07741 [Candidatus Haloredivivus sp. G17]